MVVEGPTVCSRSYQERKTFRGLAPSLCVLSQAYNLKQAVKPTIRIRVASSTSPANVLGKEPETEPEERKEEGDNHGEATEKRELYTIAANNVSFLHLYS
ncbi:hypothetical protein HZH66_001078 [Vespula vulgaris]|uniref:Uncharacterized protein n=1 Tax=Vespula vulgaris TaxID=7454 RepID=A0A834KUC7_VESVU|nr:hypothetical protein HZH66_001078 [Vespula vulgaris]